LFGGGGSRRVGARLVDEGLDLLLGAQREIDEGAVHGDAGMGILADASQPLLTWR
jgi:hypothetical protein